MGTSSRDVAIAFNGSIKWAQIFAAAINSVSPEQIQIIDLSSGANTITVPTGGDSVPTGVTILPPAGNAVLLTLKGASGDSGIALHNTDPTSLGLRSSVLSFVINAASAVEGVRLIWT